MKNEYLECGKIINKRGIKGELKLDCYCDSPSAVFDVKKMYLDKNGKESLDVVSAKEYKGFLYVVLSGIDSAEKADELKNRILYVSRNDVKKSGERNFIADLLGLAVVDVDSGREYGKIQDVVNFGASDIYVVSDGKNEYMLPAVDGVIIETVLDKCVKVRPIPGVFDDAEEIRE